MTISLKFCEEHVSTFEELIGKYPDEQLDSPRRSTVPLLAYWKHSESRCREFLHHLKVQPPDSIDLSFEYEVPTQGRGKGKASFTDLMITGNDLVITVEAKYREPKYETVKEWLGETPSDNRIFVLEGWLDLINNVAGIHLTRNDVLGITYQTIHRTASACHPFREKKNVSRYMVYQHFTDENVCGEKYKDELLALRKLIPSSSINFAYMGFALKKLPSFIALEQRWDTGKERGLRNDVKSGLRTELLLKFVPSDIIRNIHS